MPDLCKAGEPQIEANADKRQLIKDAALRLFVQQGLGVSTSRITKAAGVSTGLLFHYFPSKDDLILDLYGDALDGFYQVGYRSPRLLKESRDEFMAGLRIEFEDSWNWCLDNWETFQYLLLVTGAAVAKQVLVPAGDRTQIARQNAQELLHAIRQHVPLRDIPDELLLESMASNTKLVAQYVHDHPEVRNDAAFRDAAWRLYWNAITGSDS